MKSKIRVLFESFISCGKPSKGNDKHQEPAPLDESTIDAQGQRQEQEQDKPKDYAQRQGLLVKDEQKNAQLGQMVENAKVEQVERVFVMESRAKITTYRNIGTTSQQAKRSRQRPPPDFKTGSRDLM
ncbi:hypothetical protein AABB24_007406 [Solanum stoloniferum]|uniref:Uncharacterized protein n=2 Tax=Solanum TaxID=4107 RepID=A0AAF0QLN6_SOLVR|nr:uncharacterized protein LOC125819023 [Solanum verrucosum]WMV23505.1 hypothetical protein MTR67_016890 [Solanum verrucosum]